MSKSNSGFIVFPLTSGFVGDLIIAALTVAAIIVFIIGAFFLFSLFQTDAQIVAGLNNSMSSPGDAVIGWIGIIGASFVAGVLLFMVYSIGRLVAKSFGKITSGYGWKVRLVLSILIATPLVLYFSLTMWSRMDSPEKMYSAGISALRSDRPEEARNFFERVAAIKTGSPWFERAIYTDTLLLGASAGYALAWQEEGRKLLVSGNQGALDSARTAAIYAFESLIIESDPTAAGGYIGLANALSYWGMKPVSSRGLSYLRRAAQLGSVSAQEWLTQHGHTSR